MPGKEFPYSRPIETELDMFIQWKGTDVCVDIYCPCGHHGHFDGYFAAFIKCKSCGSIYQMGTQVVAKRVHSNFVNEDAIQVTD